MWWSWFLSLLYRRLSTPYKSVEKRNEAGLSPVPYRLQNALKDTASYLLMAPIRPRPTFFRRHNHPFLLRCLGDSYPPYTTYQLPFAAFASPTHLCRCSLPFPPRQGRTCARQCNHSPTPNRLYPPPHIHAAAPYRFPEGRAVHAKGNAIILPREIVFALGRKSPISLGFVCFRL